MHCRMEELCRKEVICVENAARLGYITDVTVDTQTGCVINLCVTGGAGGFFRPPPPLEICWSDILKIGNETVLVKKQPEPPPEPTKRRRFPGR